MQRHEIDSLSSSVQSLLKLLWCFVGLSLIWFVCVSFYVVGIEDLRQSRIDDIESDLDGIENNLSRLDYVVKTVNAGKIARNKHNISQVLSCGIVKE